MARKKFSEYEYIQFNRKITNKKMMRIIKRLADQWEISNNDACYKLLEKATLEFDKPPMYAGLK